MAYNPKTPSHHRSRSEIKTPLTQTVTAGMNAMSLGGTSATKSSNTSVANPFVASRPSSPSSKRGTGKSKSRAASPIKRTTGSAPPVSASLKRQASAGLLRKGGVEAKLDVVTHDYVPPPKSDKKRSKSQSSVRDTRDRFIPTRDPADEVAATLDKMSLNPQSASPGHTARLAAATGVPLNRRVLSYHEPPPTSSSDPLMAQAREFARPLYARPGALPNSTSVSSTKGRKIATQPERVLDAPGMVDDFYLNLVAWSSLNILAVALAENTYIWRADSGEVVHLGEAPEGSYVAAVDFSNDGQFLGVGTGTGAVELWDVETQTKLRTMAGHASQVACLSWYQHLLTSGCGDGSIWHHDVRVARHKVGELMGHQGEVCGLGWRSDGELLASGGNDNVVNVWDGRVGDVGPDHRATAKWTKRNHTAAVKAIAWCPWQPSLLASGGGTSDASIHIWNTTTGARLHSLATPSQITSIQWSPHKKELLSTHGYPTNAIMVHAYPSMERVVEIRDAHDSRVLWSAIGPAGDVVCTGAGDENLKFWRIWEVPKPKKTKDDKDIGRTRSTSSSMLSIR